MHSYNCMWYHLYSWIVKLSKTSTHHYQVLTRHRMIYQDDCFPIQRWITKNQVYSITSNQAGGNSLIPRPSHHPVVDAFYHVSDVNICLGRQRGRGALIWKSVFEALFAVNLCIGVLNICEAKKLPLIVRDEECVCETCCLFKGLFVA